MAVFSKFRIIKQRGPQYNDVKFLEGIKVQDKNKKWVKLSTIWYDCPVILKVLRRLGCPLCRYEARILSELKPVLDKMDVRLAAITFDEVGLTEFLAGGFWEWDLYVDKERATYRALGLETQSMLGAIADIFSASGRSAIKAAKSKGISGNFKGDGFQLGGTFVITPDQGLIYQNIQNNAAVYPSIKEMFALLGGDPDLMEEIAPIECVSFEPTQWCTRKTCA